MFGIFLKPSKEVNDWLVCNKKKVFNKDNKSIYCFHPPHCTLYCFDCLKLGNITKVLRSLKQTKPVDTTVNGLDKFKNDDLTSGTTYYLKVKRSAEIYQLQRKIAGSIAQYSSVKICYTYSKATWKDSYYESLIRFKSPFVGQHWIPHFTLCSTSNNSAIKFCEGLALKNFKFIQRATQISLFDIDGDNHTEIETFNLGHD